MASWSERDEEDGPITNAVYKIGENLLRLLTPFFFFFFKFLADVQLCDLNLFLPQVISVM